MRWISLFLAAVLSLSATAAGVSITDIAGKPQVIPAAYKKGTVLLFTTQDCPIANAYAPELQRIISAFSPKGFACMLVHVDVALSDADAAKHARDFGFTCPVIVDRAHQLVKATGVTMTPEAVVLSPDGKLLYRGRIDDMYVAFGKKREKPTQHDLREALQSIANGKDAAPARAAAIGCFIPEIVPSQKGDGK